LIISPLFLKERNEQVTLAEKLQMKLETKTGIHGFVLDQTKLLRAPLSVVIRELSTRL